VGSGLGLGNVAAPVDHGVITQKRYHIADIEQVLNEQKLFILP
jgi:hypothetical protein